MNIENNVFKRSCINFGKLEKFGFKKYSNYYLYEKVFLNDFKAVITIDDSGKVIGKVIDLQFDEEFINIRTEMSGEFVNKVRDEYKSILIDIKKNCFDDKYFMSDQANRITKYIKDKYNNNPEFLWEKSDGSGVFRNTNNNKWYGIIMNVDLSKIDNGSGEVEVINVKLDNERILSLLNKKGYYKAYHMNKKYWISIILNDTLKDEEIFKLIDESYNLVK